MGWKCIGKQNLYNSFTRVLKRWRKIWASWSLRWHPMWLASKGGPSRWPAKQPTSTRTRSWWMPSSTINQPTPKHSSTRRWRTTKSRPQKPVPEYLPSLRKSREKPRSLHPSATFWLKSSLIPRFWWCKKSCVQSDLPGKSSSRRCGPNSWRWKTLWVSSWRSRTWNLTFRRPWRTSSRTSTR